jgi:hypothetical protein
MQLPVTLVVRRSRQMILALGVAHFVAGLGLQPIALPWDIKLALWTILMLSLVVAVQRSYRVAALTLTSDGQLSLLLRDGCLLAGQVAPATTVFPWLVVLQLRTGERTLSMVLPEDAIGREGHRQLRLWLRWKLNVEPA